MKDKAVIALIGWALAVILVFNVLQTRAASSARQSAVEAGGVGQAQRHPAARVDDFLPDEQDSSGLPAGELQALTVNAVAIEGGEGSEASVSEDGASFTVSSDLEGGDSYRIYLALNNASEEPQMAELVGSGGGLSFEVEMPSSPIDTFVVEKKSPNRWLIKTLPSARSGGRFDLLITVTADDGMESSHTLATFTLDTADAYDAFALASQGR